MAKKARRPWFQYILYASLLFLVYALYKGDYLKIPDVQNWGFVALSLLFLIAGFFGQVWSWHRVLQASEIKALYAHSLAGAGMSVFTKFIPGKVMVILGRAAYISERYELPLGRLSVVSLNTQLIALWSGLAVGSIALLGASEFHNEFLFVLALFLGLSLVLFLPIFHQLASKILSKILKKEVQLPHLKPKLLISSLFAFFLYWTLWAIGFYFLVRGIFPDYASWNFGFCFPLATTVGVMAIFAPGGLGIREGVLVFMLKLLGMEITAATTIAVSSRLWFFIGESCVFIAGTLAHRMYRDKKGT